MSDPAMASKIMRLANSSYYGFRHKVTDVTQAVTLLGYPALKNALLSSATFDLFRVEWDTRFDLVGLWQHSLATASAAKFVSQRVRFPNPEKAYTAALLHDIGKIIIARFLPSSLASVVTLVQEEHITMFEAETRLLNLAHPAFGAWMMTRWGLPKSLVEAVEFHHEPGKAKHSFDLAAIVYLSNILAHGSGIGSGGDRVCREADGAILSYFDLDEEAVRDLRHTLVFRRLEIESYAIETAA
jgi:putative nucleotidyltransferase with HDIG domain